MPCPRNNVLWIAAAAALLSAGGCQAPWTPHGNEIPLESAQRRPEARPRPAETATAKTPELKAATAAADEATVSRVMQEAQAISARDPLAGKLLLDELSRTEPKLWPLAIEQFRSQQAYHDQLVARRAKSPPKRDMSVIDPPPAEPPSAELGHLTDPRRARPDPEIERRFAMATPANMPAPLGPLDAEPPVLAQTPPQPFEAEDSGAEVIQVAAAEGNPLRDGPRKVQPALYSVDEKPPAQAAAEPTSRDWQGHLDLAIDDLSDRLAEGPQSTAEVHQLVSLRLLTLLAGRTEEALTPIPNVSTEEQDYWSDQMFALATFLDHHRQPNDDRRAAASVIHLDEAVGHLRELGSLALRNLAFCKNVYGYGAYEPINDPRFSAGEQVTLYLEVENYHSESTEKGYTTLLGAGYEILDDAGQRVAGGEFPNIEDCCQSRRRDFHIQYGLVLPRDMKAGKHRLKLVMKDQQSDKLGNASIAFDVR